MTDISFGENLKKLRKAKGLTRAQFAEALCYSEKSVEKWELAGVLPPVRTVCRAAELLGVTVDALLKKSEEPVTFYLGIDGGGTKTEFLLTDQEKNEIAHFALGPSNPVDVGMERCKAVLEEGIRRIGESVDLSRVSVFAGLAGGITGDNKRLIGQFLSTFPFGAARCGSDIENALEHTFGGKDGLTVIMGTGIVAFRREAGMQTRIGGWGYLIDAGGSGFHFGSAVLDSALKYFDSRGGSEFLFKAVTEKLGKPIDRAISEIYRGGKAYIASFAPLAFTAYQKGDPEGRRILAENAKECALLIRAGLRETSLPVTICGGLARFEAILRPLLEQELGKGVSLSFLSTPMVLGALSLAKKNADKGE